LTPDLPLGCLQGGVRDIVPHAVSPVILQVDEGGPLATP